MISFFGTLLKRSALYRSFLGLSSSKVIEDFDDLLAYEFVFETAVSRLSLLQERLGEDGIVAFLLLL